MGADGRGGRTGRRESESWEGSEEAVSGEQLGSVLRGWGLQLIASWLREPWERLCFPALLRPWVSLRVRGWGQVSAEHLGVTERFLWVPQAAQGTGCCVAAVPSSGLGGRPFVSVF